MAAAEEREGKRKRIPEANDMSEVSSDERS